MQKPPQNCWRVVIEDKHARQQHQVYQQASALILFDMAIREALAKGLAPVTISLLAYDAEGCERLLVQAVLPTPAH